jgi:1,4-dihydroxy-2-naphthoate octaprenyltransferase
VNVAQLAAFVRLSRFKFLAGGFIGGAFGTAIAAYERGVVDWLAYALAQVTITGAHLMTQYANEYFDRESDALTTRTAFSGGSGALVDGSLQPRVALLASLCCLLVSCAGAFALLARGHGVAALLGCLCLALAWAYSAPPFRLLALGLGELDTALVVAILVPLCAYAAQAGTLDARAIASTLPAAAAMFAMMICVEVPDRVADAATGKRNLVVRYGVRAATTLGIAASAAAIPAIGAATFAGAPRAYALLEMIAIVPIVWLGIALVRLRSGDAIPNETVAGRGVYAFVCVGILGVLGYAGAAHAP